MKPIDISSAVEITEAAIDRIEAAIKDCLSKDDYGGEGNYFRDEGYHVCKLDGDFNIRKMAIAVLNALRDI